MLSTNVSLPMYSASTDLALKHQKDNVTTQGTAGNPVLFSLLVHAPLIHGKTTELSGRDLFEVTEDA